MDDNDKDFIELAEMINELYTNIVRHYGSIIPLAAIIERKKTDPYKRLMELQQEIDRALEIGDKEAFMQVSREYNYLKEEFCVGGERK
ncbi:MAG TPA: IDEAL domain-containing protein [Bacillota bacterium]|jgi:hypothetical protein|nr:IDEAL domain-containing protein [Bacillota bacterium]HQD42405.1 IDEAL domain-containing protein [Bacillota bacterium]